MSQLPQLLADDIPPYQPSGEAAEQANNLINWLAWGASAAGVLGLIIVGANMTLQLRAGEPGEGATHYRGFFIVMVASVIATSAGPIVEWFGPYTP
ncbi:MULTISPECIES: hypothetical protein [unclassified Streptomyces]|uniref:hypothetical protein n=1 Tax=unclassified Streptomyces TaxID=2593676 RepID=UPI002DD9613B|nr:MULTISPECIES: hypothetical protein [unclassified Streptomyces]WSA91378.1 hypothetical protein OIE63_07270 [Streptomyces sp. NBC_01795]WSB75702.1 hypothetical protein OHB04_07795 [Streptomyces sp. NBC_01775]WSS16014.1 hypothetical protein OG533_32095 [Streptomyces sp. NBC_01186]WSS44832.1 hypothetical protein OG220_32775 [Streptomyces sp. NBC_01187]